MRNSLSDEDLTAYRLQSWASQAAAGASLTYHVGSLGADRVSDKRVDAVAKTAADLAASRGFDLFQRRFGDFDHVYLITRRRRPSA